MNQVYHIDAEKRLFRKDTLLAVLPEDGGRPVWESPDLKKRYARGVAAFLKREADAREAVMEPVAGGAVSEVAEIAGDIAEPEVKEPETSEVSSVHQDEEEEVEASSSVEAEREGDSALLSAPELTAEAGDKTPAYVEWLRDHDPKEFRRRYGVKRKAVTVRRVAADGEAGGENVRIVARRTTHLTVRLAD